MTRHTANDIEHFVQEWLAEHLQVHPGLTNVPLEVDRLAAHLTGDARIHGITGGDMHRVLGDIDAYLTERYVQATGTLTAADAAGG